LAEFSIPSAFRGSEGLLRGHPKMHSYEVAVKRGPQARGSD
jgi:hypothetical protein